MKMLKKACRNRTALLWKRWRTEYETALAAGLAASMAALTKDAQLLQVGGRVGGGVNTGGRGGG